MVSSGMLRRVALVRTVFLRSLRRLLVTASVVPSSPILVTQMKEALSSSETSVLTRATRRHIPEDAILHLKPYMRKCHRYPCAFFSELSAYFVLIHPCCDAHGNMQLPFTCPVSPYVKGVGHYCELTSTGARPSDS
jgi:hypothetical protein